MYEDFFSDFTPGLIAILKPAYEFHLRQITASEFAEALKREKNKIVKLSEEVKELEFSMESVDSVKKELGIGYLGTSTVLSAIDYILEHFREDDDAIETGLRMAKKGYLLVKEAIDLTSANLKIMADTLEDKDMSAGSEMIIPEF